MKSRMHVSHIVIKHVSAVKLNICDHFLFECGGRLSVVDIL